MKIVSINGQNHKGSSYYIGHIIVDYIISQGETEQTDVSKFFLPRDLKNFCAGCYKCLDDEAQCPFYVEKNELKMPLKKQSCLFSPHQHIVFQPPHL